MEESRLLFRSSSIVLLFIPYLESSVYSRSLRSYFSSILVTISTSLRDLYYSWTIFIFILLNI